MRIQSALLGLFVVLILVTPQSTAAGIREGPFVGSVEDGDTVRHTYSNYPLLGGCLAVWIPTDYFITITFAPGEDTLSLSAKGQSIEVSGGVGTLRVVANYCTSFAIDVGGVDVDDEAHYVVSVRSSGSGSGT